MKSFAIILWWLIIHALTTHIHAQNFYNSWYYNYDLVWEAGIGTGIMNSLTDVGGKKGNGRPFLKDIRWSTSRPCLTLYAGVSYKDMITIRLNWQSGSVNGADSLLKKEAPDPNGRYGRNLSFRSRIREISLLAEAHPLFWNPDVQDHIPTFSPYIIGGISYYSFNPQARLGDHWLDLQPLRTEGQGISQTGIGRSYKLKQFAVPIGAGIRYETGPLINIRLECIYRLLFTDYLDDVSTIYINPTLFDLHEDPSKAAAARELYFRMDEHLPGSTPATGSPRGNAKKKDAYFSVQVVLGYVFRKKVK